MGIIKPIIKREIRNIKLTRKGRGFSRSELKESGLDNLKVVRKNRIPIDVFRKTKIPENIEQLKPIVKEILDIKKQRKKNKANEDSHNTKEQVKSFSSNG
jgi:ribosomal protein L13E